LLDIAFGIDRRVKTSYPCAKAARPLMACPGGVDSEVGVAGAIGFWLAIGKTGARALLLGPLVAS
jgi:hypothetical protein